MKFKFRLQTVYDLRKHLESEQKDALARERQKLNELIAEEQRLKVKFKLWSSRYLEAAGAGMSPSDAVIIGRYLDELQKSIIQAGRGIERQNAVVERERLLLIEKMKERKTIETLHDKQHERFNYDEGRRQEKEIEELITSRR